MNEIYFLIAGAVSLVMAVADVRSKGHKTHDTLALLLLTGGIIHWFWMADPARGPSGTSFITFGFHFIFVSAMILFGNLLERAKKWGSSDSLLLAGVSAILPLDLAIAFPRALLVGIVFYLGMYTLYTKYILRKNVNWKEQVPLLPAFCISLFTLYTVPQFFM